MPNLYSVLDSSDGHSVLAVVCPMYATVKDILECQTPKELANLKRSLLENIMNVYSDGFDEMAEDVNRGKV